MTPQMQSQQQQMMMHRMRMQQMQQMQQMPGRPDGMMPNGSNMEMMMRGPGPGGMQGMQRGQPGMGGPMMMQGMRPGMMPGHPMHQGMGSRPPPPEYGMSSQVSTSHHTNINHKNWY